MRTCHRGIFQSPHAALACIAKPFHRIETLGCATLRCQPCVDERIPEFVRQRIREQAWQSVKRVSGQCRIRINLIAQWHDQRGKLDSALRELGIILERRHRATFLDRHCADCPAPKLDFCNHDPSPHVHLSAALVVAFLPVARFLSRPICFSCVMGLASAFGSKLSKFSISPSIRQTRSNPDNCVATAPDSSRSNVRLEMPA